MTAKRPALNDFEEEVKKLCSQPRSSQKEVIPPSAKKRKISEPCSLTYSEMCSDFKSAHHQLIQAADELAGSHKKAVDKILKEKTLEIKRLKDKHISDLDFLAEEFEERLTRETNEIRSLLTKHASRLVLQTRINMAKEAETMGLVDSSWDVTHWRIKLMELEDSDEDDEENKAGPSALPKDQGESDDEEDD